MAIWKGLKIKDAELIETPVATVNKYMDELVEAVEMLNDVVKTKQDKDYLYKLAKKKEQRKKVTTV